MIVLPGLKFALFSVQTKKQLFYIGLKPAELPETYSRNSKTFVLHLDSETRISAINAHSQVCESGEYTEEGNEFNGLIYVLIFVKALFFSE